jgi:predicted nucleic acid-binding protein
MTMMVDKVFIDTNVLLRANVLTAPEHSKALNMLQRLYDQGDELWISRQVLREYISNVTRPQTYASPISSSIVQQQVQAFETMFRVADETAPVTQQLISLLQEFPTGGRQIHDANMLVYGITKLATFNVVDMKRFSSKITILEIT